MARDNELNLIIGTKLDKSGFIKDAEDLTKISEKYAKKIDRFLSGQNKRLPKNVIHNKDKDEYSSFHRFGKDVYKVVHVIKDGKATLQSKGRTSWQSAGKAFGIDVDALEAQLSIKKAKEEHQKYTLKLQKEQQRLLNEQQLENKKALDEEFKARKKIEAISIKSELRNKKDNQKLLDDEEKYRMSLGQAKFDSLLMGGSTKIQQTRIAIASLKEEIKALGQAYSEAFAEGKDTSEIEQKALEKQSELNRQQKSLEKQTKIGPLQKFWNTFKRIGIYRLFRAVFASIRQGFQQGIQSLVAFDKESNKTMSSIASSTEKIFGGLTLAVLPIIEMLEPILESVSVVIADIGNSISRASAESKGLSEYSKVNLEYMKNTANEANKLLASFDKFETLNGKESLWVTGNVDEDKEKGLMSQTKSFLIEISGILAVIGSYKIVEWFTGDGPKKFIESLSGIKGKIDDISNAGLIASSAFAFVASVVNLITVIKDWESASLVTKITAITSAVLALAAVIFSIIAAVSKAEGVARVMKAISIGLTGASILTGAVSAMRFEDGGVPERGSLFIAGESGAELVHSMPSGQTGVTNIVQFKEAMVEALYESADLFKQEQTPVVLNIDCAEIARSKRFKEEINKTNSGLYLR